MLIKAPHSHTHYKTYFEQSPPFTLPPRIFIYWPSSNWRTHINQIIQNLHQCYNSYLLTSANKRLFHTQCLPQFFNKPLQSVYCRTQGQCLFLSSRRRSPCPSVAIFALHPEWGGEDGGWTQERDRRGDKTEGRRLNWIWGSHGCFRWRQ